MRAMLINQPSMILPILESPPVGLGVGVHHPTEMLTQIACGAEAAALCHGFDRKITHLEESPSEMDALSLQPLVRGRSGSGEETAGEGARAHGRSGRQIAHRQWFVQVRLCPCDSVGEEFRVLHARQRRIDELGLASIVLRGDHQVAASRVAISVP